MKDKESSNVKYAFHVFLRTLLSSVLCVFLFLSVSVLSLGLFGSNVGYRITEATESGELVVVKEYYYKLGEEEVTSLKLPEGQMLEQIRDISPGVQRGVDIVTQLLMLVVVGAFPYTMMWTLGDKDTVGVRYRGHKEKMFRGLLIGALGSIPSALLYVFLLLSKFGLLSGSYLALYRLLNMPYLPYLGMIVPASVQSAVDLTIAQLLGIFPIVLVVPLVCCVAYILGYKQISIQEHATYVGIKKGNADTEI